MTQPYSDNPISEELLSAYLDGECTPEESAEIDRCFEEHPQLREIFDEFRDVKRTVCDLPCACAPVDFHKGVLASIRKPKEIPATSIVSSADVTSSSPAVTVSASAGNPAGSRGAPLRRWGALLAACFVVGLGVWSMNRNQTGSDRLVSTVAAPLPDDSPTVPGLSFGRGALGKAATRNASAPVNVVGVSSDVIRQKLLSLGRMPVPGNSLAFADYQQETPILIEMTVVDVDESLNQFRVLLKERAQLLSETGEPLEIVTPTGSEMKTVSLDMEMDGPQMATLLNGMPALNAVMYVEQDALSHSEFAFTDFGTQASDTDLTPLTPMTNGFELTQRFSAPESGESRQGLNEGITNDSSVETLIRQSDSGITNTARTNSRTEPLFLQNYSFDVLEKKSDFLAERQRSEQIQRSSSAPPAVEPQESSRLLIEADSIQPTEIEGMQDAANMSYFSGPGGQLPTNTYRVRSAQSSAKTVRAVILLQEVENE